MIANSIWLLYLLSLRYGKKNIHILEEYHFKNPEHGFFAYNSELGSATAQNVCIG